MAPWRHEMSDKLTLLCLCGAVVQPPVEEGAHALRPPVPAAQIVEDEPALAVIRLGCAGPQRL